MEERTIYQRIAEAQQRLKESPAFLIIATVALGTDMYAHYRFGWDRDWGGTNFALSVEALYNGIFVLMAFAVANKLARAFQDWLRRDAEERRKQLERMETVMETQSAILAFMAEKSP